MPPGPDGTDDDTTSQVKLPEGVAERRRSRDDTPDPHLTETVRTDEPSHVLIRRFSLTVVAGPDAGKSFQSKAERTVIGSHESCDLVLTDPTVSRFHCDISLAGKQAMLRDTDSANGTLLDGVSIMAAYLRGGAVLTLGRTQVRFEPGAEHVKVPLSGRERFGVMVGWSPAMRRVFAQLEKAAASDATVLLEGETGTGKEAAAESLHRESARRNGPFIVVDCGAIPPQLLESELFGHERGAFTGAVAARVGAFEAAHGGTIFLDEIGELPSELQPKLLRVLERREVKRVGSNKHEPVDVRVVAATNRNLKAEVNAKTFRSDLYYRLAVLEVRLPALRERAEDMPILVEHILGALGVAGDAEAEVMRSKSFLTELQRHAWPGNVRELRNYVERCLALRETTPLADPPDEPDSAFDAAVDLDQPLKQARDEWTRAFERRYLDGLLRAHDGNVTAAARSAGVDRIHLYRLLWRHGMR